MAPLPAELVMCEWAVASLRAYLDANGLDDYRIVYGNELDLDDIDLHFEALGDSPAWETPAESLSGGQPLATLTHDDDSATFWGCGFLRLRRYQIVLARWYARHEHGCLQRLILVATPSPENYLRLRREVLRLRRQRGTAVWQIVHGESYEDGTPVPRKPVAAADLVLTAQIRQRIDADLVHFFSSDVAALYASLGVPYRRGVLLHGPPGNGKTSIIRLLGASLPHIPALILRPSGDFSSDSLEHVISRWQNLAPAILVIEDLNWLLEKVNISTFLNLIDGIESAADGGLLLIATTNHPDQLDPAINNRPGRFDVVIEIPCPDENQRLEFFKLKLPDLPADVLRKLADRTHKLSFSHLQEILKLSGLLTIQAGRTRRTVEDVLGAADAVRSTCEDAERGFPAKPDMPFGLGYLHQRKEAGSDELDDDATC